MYTDTHTHGWLRRKVCVPVRPPFSMAEREVVSLQSAIGGTKRRGEKRTCEPCHRAKTKCDGRRPCSRCLKRKGPVVCRDWLSSRPKRRHLSTSLDEDSKQESSGAVDFSCVTPASLPSASSSPPKDLHSASSPIGILEPRVTGQVGGEP